MARHQVIVLEDSPNSNFTHMLNRDMSIENCLMEIDSGFPEFERLMCRSLRKLHEQGKEILQIEPYLERLLEIHEHFAAGKTPADILKLPELNPVYQAEKKATGALITYYRRSIQTDFSAVIASVNAFAKADAERCGHGPLHPWIRHGRYLLSPVIFIIPFTSIFAENLKGAPKYEWFTFCTPYSENSDANDAIWAPETFSPCITH